MNVFRDGIFAMAVLSTLICIMYAYGMTALVGIARWVEPIIKGWFL